MVKVNRRVIRIREPIWGSKSVGIALYKLKDGLNKVKILYKDQRGRYVYPGTYLISRARALRYDRQKVGSFPQVTLAIIPIADMEKIK